MIPCFSCNVPRASPTRSSLGIRDWIPGLNMSKESDIPIMLRLTSSNRVTPYRILQEQTAYLCRLHESRSKQHLQRVQWYVPSSCVCMSHGALGRSYVTRYHAVPYIILCAAICSAPIAKGKSGKQLWQLVRSGISRNGDDSSMLSCNFCIGRLTNYVIVFLRLECTNTSIDEDKREYRTGYLTDRGK